MLNDKRNSLIYAIITALVFTTLEPVSKLIANQVTPFAITFWRCMIGSLILMPFAIGKIKKQKIEFQWKDLRLETLLGTLLICISLIALQIGIQKADKRNCECVS